MIMGNSCCTRKKEKKKIVLLLVGLDNAGKSVAIKGLAGESLETVLPTVGLSVTYLKHNEYTIKVFDLGGSIDIRGIWQRYFVDVHGVIFVIDSSDHDRLDEAKQVLTELLSHEKIAGKPILLLANKQDRQEALDELDLVDKLELEILVNAKQCPTLLETCCARAKLKLDPGIQRGYQWLINFIARNYQNLDLRVEKDVIEQELEERKERLEKLEKLKKLHEILKDDDIIESYSDYNCKSNGNIIQDNYKEQKDIFYIDNGYIQNVTSPSSSNSNNSFLHTYYEYIQQESTNRPKSAVQLVKEQLQIGNSHTSSFKAVFSNKTAPVSFYGTPHPKSATDRRTEFCGDRRKLKSAGDSLSFSAHNKVINGSYDMWAVHSHNSHYFNNR
ncbi:hypothetical protein FQA39_LY12654 [Lamprigera yunnana]|nr:hypothetical protein FQA39_LY12654 [Lamprigera yunnana]